MQKGGGDERIEEEKSACVNVRLLEMICCLFFIKKIIDSFFLIK